MPHPRLESAYPDVAPVRRSPSVLVMFALVLLGVFLGQTIWTRLDGARDANGATPTTGPAAPRTVAPRGPLAADEQSTISLFKQVSPSVVYVTTLQRMRNRITMDITEVPAGTGTGFIWDADGDIVTNFHVTGMPTGTAYSVTLNDQSTYPAELVGIAPNNDLAVLKIKAPPEKLKPIPLGTSSDLQVGQYVMAIGNPFGLDQSLTTGVVSALGRTITSPSGIPIEDVVQTDAAINPGNSGGPLLDSSGRLIGVNAQIRSATESSAGVGFAIPVDTVNRVVPSILRNYRPGRPAMPTQPSLGIKIASDVVNARVAQYMGVHGVVVMDVAPDGPAEQAGITPVQRGPDGPEINDIIVGIGGHKVGNRPEMVAALGHFDPNQDVTVRLWRRGEEREVHVKLATEE